MTASFHLSSRMMNASQNARTGTLCLLDGIMMHRATLAATAVNLTARICSDGARDTVNDALGIAGTPNQSLSMLLVGHSRPSPMLVDFFPGATLRQHEIQPVE